MTPEEKEALRQELEQQIPYVCGEWFRTLILDKEDHPLEGVELRIDWEHPTAGAVICTVHDSRYGEPLARFGVHVIVDTLLDLPPIGPENDLGIYGIDEQPPGPTLYDSGDIESACALKAVEESYRSEVLSQEWVPATFLMCLAGDRIRLSGQETDVLRSSSGVWNVNTSDAWHPTPWVHTELRMDLSAAPGFKQYPPNTPCEILMSPERKAAHLLMQTFPGSQIVS